MPTLSPLSTDAEMASPPGRVDRRVQEFRARVLTTAEELFTERGIGELVREVAVTVRTPENEVLNHSPTGKVPALVVDEGPDKGLVLLESSPICEYLDTIGNAPAG